MTAPETWLRGFFEFSDRDLLEKCRDDFASFLRERSTRRLIDVVSALGHMLNWIEASAQVDAAVQPNREESAKRFKADVRAMPAWQAIEALCNRAKHYHKPRQNSGTSAKMTSGLSVGLGTCVQPLDHRHFAIGLGDSWVNAENLIRPLIDRFQEWFDGQERGAVN